MRPSNSKCRSSSAARELRTFDRLLAASVAVLSITASSCAKKIEDGGSSEVDFSDPKKVVASVFYAAASGVADHLPSLCDPREGARGGAAKICAVTRDGPDWQSFVSNFSAGRIIGEPRISGDSALVNVAYGPDGATAETFVLVRRGGAWFLADL